MKLINIITCCIRSYNLPTILQSIIEARGSHIVQLCWYIVFDLSFLDNTDVELKLDELPIFCQKNDVTLNPMICDGDRSPVNVALENIENGFVTIIDDDNLMHPNYFNEILPELENGWSGLLYNQDMGSMTRIVYPYRVKPLSIDTAQFTFSREIIGERRWPDKFKQVPAPDGIFISKVYESARDHIKIIPKTLCYYNKLA